VAFAPERSRDNRLRYKIEFSNSYFNLSGFFQPERFAQIIFVVLHKRKDMNHNTNNVNKLERLIPGNTYHIFNKAIGTDKLFIGDKDYSFFLKKLDRFILPVADILSYCLIPNHFHLLIDFKEIEELPTKLQKQNTDNPDLLLSKVFSNFFNSYSKSFNKAHDREGRLFLYPFKRIIVEDDEYLVSLINYIHRNPVHHGLTKLFSEWKYSSYNATLSGKPTKIKRDFVLSLFGSKGEMITFHKENSFSPEMEKYVFE